MNSTKLEPHHLDLPTRRYTFLNIYTNLSKRIKQPENGKPNPTAGPARKNTADRKARAGVAQVRLPPQLSD